MGLKQRMAYKGQDKTVGDGYLKLEHGERYDCMVDVRRSGKVQVTVNQGFVRVKLPYSNRRDFELDWVG